MDTKRGSTGGRSLERARLLAAWLLLAAGCSDGLPDGRPTTVKIQNLRAKSFYVNGSGAPFTIRDAGGQSYSASKPSAPLCSRCDDHCSSRTSGDPAVVYLEIPAGKTRTLSWEGRVFAVTGMCSECGASCSSVWTFSDGNYSFAVPYVDSLPTSEPLSSSPNEDGTVSWIGGIGGATLTKSTSFSVTYRGESEIVLPFQ
jgi:hypothetical protein